ncbi:hsp20/alpha crystallin family domain-containing protein [Ditylenchus destructor]|uniref:Hsp20/alpha crystallin family domain-containing protein n=1 Tax=Ditylenchus destructor TaxID=166010 RepID=A0AAD4N554_9BILA|nr:hsp20/alpha crystallin family domain-containing protein [Ditylenchus destructor]
MTEVEVTHNWTADQWDWPLQHADGVVLVNNTNDRWEVELDAQQFTPNEIEVKVAENTVIINCRHDERSDAHGLISREVSRCYHLPPEVDATTIKTHMTRKGTLHITAQKPARVVPPFSH